jgi:hypothetical protein
MPRTSDAADNNVADLLGAPTPAPSNQTSAPTLNSAPTVSSTPGPGVGIATDQSGFLPVSVAVQSIVETTADPTSPAIGQMWYRQDTRRLSIRHDATTTVRITAVEGYTSYAPAWTSSGVAPAIGNGTASGHYIQIGKFVHAQGTISFGSTSTFGTGNYYFAMPVAPSGSQAGTRYGLVTGFHSGSFFTATADFQAGSTFRTMYAAAFPTGALTFMGQLAPWTWASGDEIQFNIVYEAA